MQRSQTTSAPPENRLLGCLPHDCYQRLLPHLEPVTLGAQQVLFQPGDALAHVYFPRTPVVSWLVCLQDGTAVEHSTIGREGVVGVLAFLGREATFNRAVVQVPGEVLRLGITALRHAAPPGSPLHDLFCRYVMAYMRQLSQSAACNAVHSVRQRCCRWLLTTQDRVRSDRFALTQEVLARALAVRRASVTEVAQDLQRAGLIGYARGVVLIVDRPRLEEAACECYGILKAEYDHLLGQDVSDGG